MKTGKTLIELASEVTRQQELKKDYLADTRKVRMAEDGTLSLDGGDSMPVTSHCHSQIADRLQIPKKYYDRCRSDQPELLAQNVNGWFDRNPETRMIRTMDGNARAFLSNKYRPLDNFDLLQPILPKLSALNLQIDSCEITDRRLYLKATDPQRVRVCRRRGYYDGGQHDKIDTYTPGVIISNSEIGSGSLWVAPGIHKAECTNLAIFKNDGIAKYHVGGKNESDPETWQYFSDDTRRKSDEVLFAKLADMVSACLTGDLFSTLVERMERAGLDNIEVKAPACIEEVSKRYSLSQDESTNVLEALIRGADFTRLGVSAAITRACQRVDDYDRSTEMERIGGQIIEMPRAEWEAVAC